jgi:anti-sigma regulatory factor (Ser/Thr protein kinase)/DNA-binding NarL/FixJ family response regulator
MSRVLLISDECHSLTDEIGSALAAMHISLEHALGQADALKQLRMRPFEVVITSCQSAVEDDLALLAEMRAIRPGVRCILLARESTPDDVIAAMRAHVFACYTPPFSGREIARVASYAATDSEWKDDIQILSAKPEWVSVRAHCRLTTAERLLTFERELGARLPEDTRREMMQALREILLNAIEHGAAFDPEQVVEVMAIRTARSFVFYIRDPGAGFRMEQLKHAAIANPPENPAAHVLEREREGLRPGGYGLLVARGTVDELIFSEIGNEVVLIKYVKPRIDAGNDWVG